MPTMVATKTSTGTKVTVVVGTIALFGLAAYGYGFGFAVKTTTKTFPVVSCIVAGQSVTGTGKSCCSGLVLQGDICIKNVSDGSLSVYPDAMTPVSGTIVMGTTGIELARFDFKASTEEDIKVTKVVVSDIMSGLDAGGYDGKGTLANFKLFDVGSGVQLGGTIAAMNATLSGVAPVIVFDNISNLTVPKGGTKTLKVVVQVTTYSMGAVSGSHHRLVIMPDFKTGKGENLTTPTAELGVVAIGAVSNKPTIEGNLRFLTSSAPANVDSIVKGNDFTVYRTKLTVAKAADAPAGLSRPGSAQVVAKFVMTNSANVDNQSAALKLMNLDIGTTISNVHPSQESDVRLYRDSVGAGNLLATSYGCPGVGFVCTYSGTSLTDAQFADTDISAGTSKTFIVTMNTADAKPGSSLTVGLPVGGITWSDGLTAAIASVDSLPIQGNVLAY